MGDESKASSQHRTVSRKPPLHPHMPLLAARSAFPITLNKYTLTMHISARLVYHLRILQLLTSKVRVPASEVIPIS